MFAAEIVFSDSFFQAGLDTAFRGEYCNDDEIAISRVCAVKIALFRKLNHSQFNDSDCKYFHGNIKNKPNSNDVYG